MDDEGSLRQVTLRLLEDFTIVGVDPLLALVASQSPPAFRDGVKASAVASQLGIGLSYALDRYVPDEDDDSTPAYLHAFQELYFLGKAHMASTLDRMQPVEEPTVGESYADAALCRLESTYFSAGLLFRTGHLFEARTVCRLFLEQVAWAYAVRDVQTYELAERFRPHSCISQLGDVDPAVGRLYGELSEEAHLGLDDHLRFLRFPEGRAEVIIAYGRDSLLSGSVLLDLADLWACVYERTQYRHFPTVENWTGPLNGLRLNRDRPFVSAAADAKAKLLTA